MKRYNKSEVMKRAHCYMKCYNLNRSQSLKLAWMGAALKIKDLIAESLNSIANEVHKSSNTTLTININLFVGNNNSNIGMYN